MSEKSKDLLEETEQIKEVNALDGKKIRVLMDNSKSFKLINPKTGEHIKIFMDKENKFKLFNKHKNENKKIKIKENKKNIHDDSFEYINVEKTKPKSKFASFFTEPTFNLLEMMITLIVVSLLVIFLLINAKKDFKCTESLNSNKYQTIKDSRLTEFIDLYTDITSNYYKNIDTDELLNKVTESMLEYLGDTYSDYMDEYEARNLKDRLEGKYSGLGFEIATRTDDEKVVITGIFENSPAEKAGLKVGDILKSVNEVDVTNKNSAEISLLIKDKMTGVITVVVDRDGNEMSFPVEKGTITIKAVTTEVFDKTGYIKIDTFSKAAVDQVKEALKTLEEKSITSLVIDVRNNTGGYLTSAYDIADLFIEKNKVIYKLKTNSETKVYKAKTSDKTKYNIAVLINGSSASSSEVFALAMRDSYGAKLVGSRSYGKGTVQETTKLSTGSLIKYTIANWLGPNDENVNDKGIEPDINANMGSSYMTNPTYENDGQLQKAIEAIK